MARAFLLPDLGEGLTEGEVARWLVTEGQVVAEDDPLVEIQTDKATVEIPSPYAGTVLRIVVPEGRGRSGRRQARRDRRAGRGSRRAGLGRRLVTQCHKALESRRVSEPGRAQATPLVRKIATELGVDLATVSATGPGGRITEDDVRAAAGGGVRRRDGASRCAGSAA